MQRDQVTALILAGGKATRMGGVDEREREIAIGGRTIFARQVEALAPCVAEIIVSSPRPIAGYRSVRDPVASVTLRDDARRTAAHAGIASPRRFSGFSCQPTSCIGARDAYR